MQRWHTTTDFVGQSMEYTTAYDALVKTSDVALMLAGKRDSERYKKAVAGFKNQQTYINVMDF